MISLDSGDKIRGDASAATVVDYILSGTDANAIKQLADGQLPAAIGDLYTADSVDAVTSIILVNTDSVARTVNLYLTPSGGAARRLIPKDMSLGIGHSLYTDGRTTTVMDALGNVLSTVTASAHALGSSTHTADTLSNLNTKVSDATLVDATAISSEIDGDISTHAGLADPHTGYRLESADHSHQTTGAQAGKIDHGAALDGLGDDDHTQYILHSLADAANDFLVASGANTYIKKTLAETLALVSPLTTRGDMMFMNASVNTRLAKGADNTILAMGTNDPEWKTPAVILGDLTGANLDVGAYDVRGATLTADGLTSGRVVFAGTSGVLSDDGDFLFSVDTLTVTKIGAFALAGTLDANAQAIQQLGTSYFNNAAVLQWKDAGGTVRDLLVLNGANHIVFNNDAGGNFYLQTDNAGGAGNLVTRLAISGNVATAVATCTNLTWEGLKLSGALTLNGQVFDAGSDSAQINTTVSYKGLKITSTQDSNNGAALYLEQVSTAVVDNDVIAHIYGRGRNAGADIEDYTDYQCIIEDKTTSSEAGKQAWWNKLAGSWNKAMTLSGAGALWSDLSVDTLTYKVSGTQVVSAQGAAVADPTDAASTQARLTDLLGRLRTHGLIAV